LRPGSRSGLYSSDSSLAIFFPHSDFVASTSLYCGGPRVFPVLAGFSNLGFILAPRFSFFLELLLHLVLSCFVSYVNPLSASPARLGIVLYRFFPSYALSFDYDPACPPTLSYGVCCGAVFLFIPCPGPPFHLQGLPTRLCFSVSPFSASVRIL